MRLFITYRRPASFWDALGSHLPFFLMGGLPLLFAHAIELNDLPLIPCLFLKFSGFPCPFCGYTRSFQAMAKGDFIYAFTNCPMACVLYIVCVLMFIWNAVAILSGMRLAPGEVFRLIPQKPAWLFLLCLVLMNWGYRLVCGLQ
jgi:hypothetical protein